MLDNITPEYLGSLPVTSRRQLWVTLRSGARVGLRSPTTTFVAT